MQIIDGYCNEPNIFADDIGEYNTAIWGTRDCVLPAGEQLGYELISNNEIKIKDGVFSTQGRRGVIKKGAAESCIIENGTQAENRNDLIVIEYAKDSSTLIESHTLKVIKGTPGETATDPDVVTGDIQAGDVLHQMPLYRVKLEGLNVTAVEKMFATAKMGSDDIISEEFSVTKPYEVGNYAIYNNKMYKFTTAHPAGAWNAAHVTATTVAAELAAQNKNFGGLTFAQNASGAWGYKVGGAGSVIPFKSLDIVYVGAITSSGSINVMSKCPNYKKMTAGDFLLDYQSMAVRLWDGKIGGSTINVSKSYNSSTGVLTLSNLSASSSTSYVRCTVGVYAKVK